MRASGRIVGIFRNALPTMMVRLREALSLRGRGEANWFDQTNIPRSFRIRLRMRQLLFGDSAAYGRGMKLLLENLSGEQRQEFIRCGYFHVIGGATGHRYRICTGRQMNIHELDSKKRRSCIWCFFPAGGLVDGDVMLAQKIALELYEEEALATANRMAYRYDVPAA